MGLRLFFGFELLLISTFIALALSTPTKSHRERLLTPVYSWKSLDFDFPNQAARDAAKRSGSFVEGHGVPIDVDVSTIGSNGRDSTVFITIPRFQAGVPVTLGYVTNKKNSAGEPLIAPYPDWDMQKPGGDCMGITSVYRIAIDSCKRMWILDTGKLLTEQVCRPKLLVYSLETKVLLKRYVFPEDQFSDASLFVTPMVDVRDTCDDTYVYIADVTGFSLIVYEHKESRSWRIVNKLFYPYPDDGTFVIRNESFDLMDGILGLALGPMKPTGDRILYFHSLASRVEAWVPTSVIRNYTLFMHNPEASPRSFKAFKNPRSSQSAAQAMDRNGVSFYGLMSDVAIGCWNSKHFPEFGCSNIEKIVEDQETLQFASGIKVIDLPGHKGQSLWIMTISFQKYMTGSMSPNEVNFRIQLASIEHLVRNTKCDVNSDSVNTDNIHFGISRTVPSYKHEFLLCRHIKKCLKCITNFFQCNPTEGMLVAGEWCSIRVKLTQSGRIVNKYKCVNEE